MPTLTLPFHGTCAWCKMRPLAPPDNLGIQRQTCHRCHVLSILNQRDQNGEAWMERMRPGIVAWAEEQRALGIMRGESGWTP